MRKPERNQDGSVINKGSLPAKKIVTRIGTSIAEGSFTFPDATFASITTDSQIWGTDIPPGDWTDDNIKPWNETLLFNQHNLYVDVNNDADYTITVWIANNDALTRIGKMT